MGRLNSKDNLQVLSEYHPLVIEGMGRYDSRDAISVASTINDNLQKHWDKKPPQKPLILVTQGDPYEERGISAITRCLSDRLGISRMLVFLDPSIASYHFPNADRYKVTHEISMSLLISKLNEEDDRVIPSISSLVDKLLQNKIEKRLVKGRQPLPEYYQTLQCYRKLRKSRVKLSVVF